MCTHKGVHCSIDRLIVCEGVPVSRALYPRRARWWVVWMCASLLCWLVFVSWDTLVVLWVCKCYEMDRVLGRSVHNLCFWKDVYTVPTLFTRILSCSNMETGGCHCGRCGLPSRIVLELCHLQAYSSKTSALERHLNYSSCNQMKFMQPQQMVLRVI